MSLPGMFNPMLMNQGAASGPPTIEGTATTSSSTAVTNHVINLPSGIIAGEILFVAAPVATLTGWSVPSGWTGVINTGATMAGIYKVASGAEGSTVTIVSDSGGTTAVAYRMSGLDTSTAPERSASNIATNSNPNGLSLTPSWGASFPTLYLALESIQSPSATVSAYPTNYSLSQLSAISAGAYQVGIAARLLQSSPEDPGAFTLSANANWVAYTIGFRGA